MQSSVLIFNPPPARTTPLARVLVALVPFTLSTPLVCRLPWRKVDVPEPSTSRLDEKVDVELVPVTRRKPAMVEVAVVEVALKLGMVRWEKRVEVPAVKLAAPCTERILPGLVVPMPTFPFCITLKRLPCAPTNRVEVATSACAVVVPVIWALPACTERREPGVVVPRPSLPVVDAMVR